MLYGIIWWQIARAISWPYWQHHVNNQKDNKTWIRPNVWHKWDIQQEIGNHEFVWFRLRQSIIIITNPQCPKMMAICMRPLTSKSKMKNCLGVEQSLRTLTHPDVIMLDGCALIWSVYWPTSGTMGDVVQIMVEFLQKRMDYTDVYHVFDRYHPYSPKSSTWIQRSSESAK